MTNYIAYTAAWCGPCTRLKPYLNELAKTKPLTFIDIDEHSETAKTAQIKGIPCVVRYDEQGVELSRIINPKPSELKSFVEE